MIKICGNKMMSLYAVFSCRYSFVCSSRPVIFAFKHLWDVAECDVIWSATSDTQSCYRGTLNHLSSWDENFKTVASGDMP